MQVEDTGGVTPYVREFARSISLEVETHLRVVDNILDDLAQAAFGAP